MKKSYCYNQGFKKGIEIYEENSKNDGYFADESNTKTMRICRIYAEEGAKNGQPLKPTQIDYYSGMADGINYCFRKHHIFIKDNEESTFRKYERQHNYGQERHYDGNNCWD